MSSFGRILFLGLLTITSVPLYAQLYIQDSTAVRLQLDANGLLQTRVEDISTQRNSRIVTLSFKGLGMTILRTELTSLDSLERLDLSGNLINSLPADMSGWANLSFLDLGSNALITLPPSVAQLKRLLYLNVSENPLKALPVELGTLGTLTYLLADRDSIVTLPKEIVVLPYLRYLNMANNLLTTVPFELAASAVDTLDLSFNLILVLPEELTLLNTVSQIDITRNALCAVSPGIKAWADIRDPDWAATQVCGGQGQSQPIYFQASRGAQIFVANGSLHVKTGLNQIPSVEWITPSGSRNILSGSISTNGEFAFTLPERAPKGIGIIRVFTNGRTLWSRIMPRI